MTSVARFPISALEFSNYLDHDAVCVLSRCIGMLFAQSG